MISDKTAKFVDDVQPIKRKRLKVVSACGECRRKKTKCNGERPCAGCIKARVECIYVSNHRSQLGGTPHYYNSSSRMSVATSSPSSFTTSRHAISSYASTPSINVTMAHQHQARSTDVLNHATKLSTKPSFSNTSSDARTVNYTYSNGNRKNDYIQSIEDRLTAIENILRAMIGSGKHKHLLSDLQEQPQLKTSATPAPLPMSPNYNYHPSSTDTRSESCEMPASYLNAHYSQKRQRVDANEEHYQNEYERRGTRTDRLGGYKRTIQEDSSHGYRHYAYQQQMISDLTTSSTQRQHTTGVTNSDYRLPPLQSSARELLSSSSPTATASSPSRMPTAIRDLLNQDTGATNTASDEAARSGSFSHPYRYKSPTTTMKTTIINNTSSERVSGETEAVGTFQPLLRHSSASSASSSSSSSVLASSSSSSSSSSLNSQEQYFQYNDSSRRSSLQEGVAMAHVNSGTTITTTITATNLQQHTSAFQRIAPPSTSSSAFPDRLINNKNNNNAATAAAGTF